MKLTLDKLRLNKTAKILNIESNNKLFLRRLLDLGMTKNVKIMPVFKSPLNDPTAYLIKDTIIALRENDTKNIMVESGVIDGTN